MKCINCKNDFYIKRTFSNLFSSKKLMLCDSCYKSFPIEISVQTIPLFKHTLFVYQIYKSDYKINPNSYLIEYSKVFEYLLRKNQNDLIYVYDRFNLSQSNLDLFEQISTSFEKDIFILCNYFGV